MALWKSQERGTGQRGSEVPPAWLLYKGIDEWCVGGVEVTRCGQQRILFRRSQVEVQFHSKLLSTSDGHTMQYIT